MSVPDRKIPIIRVEESTGIITVQWFDGIAGMETRLAAIEAQSSPGADLAAYQLYGAI